MQKQTVEITLLGQKIPFKSKDADPELVRQVSELVASLVHAAEERSPKGAAPHKITLLALLDLAEDYLRAKRRTERLKRDLGEKARTLLDGVSG